MIVNTDTGEILSDTYPLRRSPRRCISPSKRTYTKRRPGIYLSKEEAWAAAIVIFFLGVWFAH